MHILILKFIYLLTLKEKIVKVNKVKMKKIVEMKKVILVKLKMNLKILKTMKLIFPFLFFFFK